jgi:ADP-ribosylglycohydrolase
MKYLTDCNGNITPQGFAERLLHWSQHGFPDLGDSVGQGIGSTTLSILSHPEFISDPYKVAKDVWDQSGKTKAPNGALMRCAILGVPLFYDCTYFIHLISATGEILNPKTATVSTVIRQTRIASMVTHVDPRSTASCVAIATIISNMLRGNCHDNRSTLQSLSKVLETARKEMTDATHADQEFVKAFNATTFEELQLNTNIGYVFKTLGCALVGLRMSTLPNHHSISDAFKSIISKLVMFGGDADTNATVVGALLGCTCSRWDSSASFPI